METAKSSCQIAPRKLILRKHIVLSARYKRKFTYKEVYWGGRRVMNDNNREFGCILWFLSNSIRTFVKKAKNQRYSRIWNRFVLKFLERCAWVVFQESDDAGLRRKKDHKKQQNINWFQGKMLREEKKVSLKV